MTKVTFETAALADALREAALVAPTRGEAFDKAAGIVLEIQRDQVIVKSTDLRLWYMQWITPIAVDGDPVKWRLPSKIFSQVITKLPLDSKTRVILTQVGNVLKFQHGRKRGEFTLMDMTSYQEWLPFDPDDLTEVPNMAQQINLVEWAASGGTNVPFTGVHFTGDEVVATDRSKVARAPLELDINEPLTVPAGLLGRIIKVTDDVKAAADEHQLMLMPDEQTQVRCLKYGVEYPNISVVLNPSRPVYVKVQKAILLDAMEVAASFIVGDRLPIMRTFWGEQEIAVMLANEEAGHLGDVIDVPGQAIHDRVEIKFDPAHIMSALEHCPSQEITIGYDPGNIKKPLYIDGGDGIGFWVAPTRGLPSANS